MSFASISTTRIAAIVSIIALITASISDFLFTEWWAENAMATSIVADILVLIVGVAVVNEFVTARSRRQWQLVADYALVELASTCRHVWLRLAEQVGIGSRNESTRDEMRKLLDSQRLHECAASAVRDPAARDALRTEISVLVESSRDALTSWAPLLVETPHVTSLSRYVELQALLSRLDLALWEEATGKRPTFTGTGDPDWIAERVCDAIRLGSELEVDFFQAAAMIEGEERTETRIGPPPATG